MNWAGGQGFAQSFLGTLQGLTALERAQLEAQEFRDRRTKEKEFRGVVSEEMGRVGQQPQGFGGQIRDQVGVGPEAGMSAIPGGVTAGLREAAGVQEGMGGAARAQATALPTSTDPVTREQAMMRILERGAAIDPEKAFDFALKGMQLEDVLATRKDKAEFREWRKGFNTELSKVQELVGMADTDPNGFIAGVNKMGVDIRPVSLGGGKQVFEAYVGGRKVGQYNDLTSAAQDGMQQYTNNLLIQGAAKFAATPEQFVSILSTADRLDVDRSRLRLEERRVAIDESRVPQQTELTQAQINKLNAEAAAMGPSAARDQIRLDLAQAEQFRKQLSDIDRELANYGEGTPQYRALVAQRNQTAAALRDINTSILSQRQPSALPTGAGAAAPGGVEAARKQALTGKRPDGKPYTAQDKRDYEVTFGEKFPEAPKKAGDGPKGGRQEAIPAGLSSQEIRVMFNDAKRGGATGLAYLRQKLEANEFNVRDRLEAEKILGIR